ncbi:hypothetical protein [Bacillus cereus]|uniref:hypothetical protein n=1 Tax=Bacillus cereus TaxID=1396 RepID=UPI00093672E7|nr:hypothetical protein [Bacillus cereus]MCU5445616.1 hypothetical protein [Bacillus cereus]OKA28665.1 hypothetical protein BJR05_12380 [Bacillus cereus]
MKKSIISLIGGISFCLMFSPGNTKADSFTEKMETISKTEDALQIQWDNIGDYYELYKGGKVVWSGKDKNYIDTIENASDEEMQKYTLVSYKNNQINDVKFLKTFPKKQEDIKNGVYFSTSGKELDDLVKRANVDSEATKNYVKLNWDSIPDSDGVYEVHRDGEVIGKTSKLGFTDKNIEENKTYTYSIKAVRSLSVEEKQEVDNQLKESNENPVQNADFYTRKYELNKIVTTPKQFTSKEELEQSIQAMAAPAYKTYLRYNTFIPTKTAANPFGQLTGSYFKGDNRGFDPNGSFRTRADFEASWYNDGPKLLYSFATQPTVLYGSNGSVLSQKQAGISGMKVSNINTFTSNRSCFMRPDSKCRALQFNMNHDVGIAIYDWLTPDITYAFNATIYEDDTVRVSGEHDQAPSHELYLSNNTLMPMGHWTTQHQFTHKGFEYLFPSYPNAKISAAPYTVFSTSN